MINRKVIIKHVNFTNAKDLKKLLSQAESLVRQLEKTLDEIQKFEPKVKIDD